MKRISALLLCLLLLGGCWDKQEIEDSTFVVLMGLDSAPDGALTVTLAFPQTQVQGSGAVEGMDNGSGSYAILTAKGTTLAEAMSLFSLQLSGPLALHTVKTLVISQHLAQSDMLGQVLASWRCEEIRNTANILVAADTAEDFIRARVTDALIDPLRQEELLLEQANRSAYTSPMKLLELLVTLQSDRGDGVAIYGGAAPEEEEGQSPEALRAGYLPQNAPLTSGNRSRISGLAVFRGGRMVGVLDSGEAQIFSLLAGGKATVILPVLLPGDSQTVITAQLLPQGRPAVRTRMEDGRPVFALEVALTCTISGLGNGGRARDLAVLEAHIENLCLSRMQALLTKAQTIYRADILCLGDRLAHHFSTQTAWADFGWAQRYPDARITLTVDVDMEHTGVILP